MTDSNKKVTFPDLGVSPEVCDAIRRLAWSSPSPIQREAIPAGLTGADLVGVAQTGTGKTGAFLIKAVDKLGNSSASESIVYTNISGLQNFTNVMKREAPYTVFSQKRIPEIILDKAKKSKLFKKIILVTNKKIKIPNVDIVKGGKERSDSSFNALKYLKNKKVKNVFIHDAARPNFSINLLKNLKRNLTKNMAVVPYINTDNSTKYAYRNKVVNLKRQKVEWLLPEAGGRGGLPCDCAHGGPRSLRGGADAPELAFPEVGHGHGCAVPEWRRRQQHCQRRHRHRGICDGADHDFWGSIDAVGQDGQPHRGRCSYTQSGGWHRHPRHVHLNHIRKQAALHQCRHGWWCRHTHIADYEDAHE